MSQHVIFGTGPLGKHTAKTLLERGHSVRLVNRSGNRDGLPDGAELVRGDASRPDQARKLTAGAAVVYQCAQPAYTRWAEEFPQLQASILEAATGAGAKLVVADNLYMYGPPNGTALREDHPYHATSKKGKVRAAMATTALQAHRAGRIEVALVRGSNFFGPEDHVMLDLIFKPAVTRKGLQLLGRLDQPHTFTYAPDFGRALADVGLAGNTAYGRAWHVPSNAPVTQAQLLEVIERELGGKTKRLVAGPLMVSLLGLFKPEVAEMTEMMYEWMKPFVMDSGDFSRSFGWGATPLETAVRETLEWARGQTAAKETVLPVGV
jgi:nucleoside-diphosphate-sugar epimerase